MIKKEFRLTEEGVKELQAELEELNAQKPVVAEKIRLAREQGDLSENAEYQISKDELARLESRITEIEHILQNVDLIREPAKNDTVRLGTTVELKNGGDKLIKHSIVGSVEADPLEGKISDESPLGQALLGKKVGDSVDITTPAGTTTYKITAIV